MQNHPDEPVVLRGKVFELGNYPDRGISLSEQEADQAISEFAPLPLDLEHTGITQILGHSFGFLNRLWRQGRNVLGELTIPRWLAQLLGGAVHVSLAFNRAKQVVGGALTLQPRIKDARVATFSTPPMALAPLEPEPMKTTLEHRIRAWLERRQTQDQPEQDEARAAESVEQASATFASEAVEARKFLPFERANLQALFAEALMADCGGLATFNADGSLIEGPVCQALRTMVDQRPAHDLAAERIETRETEATFAIEGVPTKRRDDLLKKTDLGREALKRKEQKHL
ncbi:MAG: hypothetical protein JSS72_01855 [Armatimonadetes bacterium]|nr:hypothetical protein [Armatimonadota bacterium]